MPMTPPRPRPRLAALGLLLALVACGGGPAPTAPSVAPTVAATTTRPTTPAATRATAPLPPAAFATPAPPPPGAATPAPATAPRTAALGTPATTVAAIATRGASAPAATVVAPAATPVPTPRGYAPGDPCAPYAGGAVPPLGRAVAAAPVRLCVPAILVSAPIVPVGATAAGAMADPPDPATIAWYAPGVVPGIPGNAALVGQVDVAGVGPGVFWDLALLAPGDTVVVVDAAGVAQRFVIGENAVYPAADAPMSHIFGPADDANLALITGAGTWDPTVGAYDSVRVVYARLHP